MTTLVATRHHRCPWHCPRVAESDSRQVTANNKLANTLNRDADQQRRIFERDQVSNHGVNIWEYSNIYNAIH